MISWLARLDSKSLCYTLEYSRVESLDSLDSLVQSRTYRPWTQTARAWIWTSPRSLGLSTQLNLCFDSWFWAGQTCEASHFCKVWHVQPDIVPQFEVYQVKASRLGHSIAYRHSLGIGIGLWVKPMSPINHESWIIQSWVMQESCMSRCMSHESWHEHFISVRFARASAMLNC